VPVSELEDSRTDDSAIEPDAEPSTATTSGIDLDAIQRDLEGVQTALERLNEGTYWTDEVTGDIIPNEILDAFPLTRTIANNTGG
jgi:RNA polymerase-binding transcription factor DksA